MGISSKIDYLRCKFNTRDNLPAPITKSKYIFTKSGKIRINIVGEGNTTVLLSPDPPNTIDHYKEIIDLISKHYRVIVFEAIGFGYSHPSWSFKFDINSYSKLIGEILDVTNTTNVILAIPCVLGFAAINYALQNQDLVKGMVIIQTPSLEEGKKWVKRIDRKNILRRRFIGQFGVWKRTKKIQKSWYMTAEPNEDNRDEYIMILDNLDNKGQNFCLASPLQSLYRSKNIFEEQILDIPSVILWGGSDKSHPNTDPYSVSKYFKNIELIECKELGHFPEMNKPNELLSAIDIVNAKELK